MSAPEASPAILAVDVGNSKTDLAIVATDGSVLAAVRGPSGSHQAVGLTRAMHNLRDLTSSAAERAGLAPRMPVARLGAFCMAGLDTTRDARRVGAALERMGLVAELLLRNDVFAILRAGAPAGWGVAVVAGAGMNAVAVGPTGRVARFGALGEIAGDWIGMGMTALAAAVRGRDGRGPRTSLERVVPAYFGLRRPADVTLALYRHRLSENQIRELAPVVFEAAAAGDEVAGAIVDQAADEIAAFAIAAIRRTSLARRPVDVVIAGGLLRSADARLLALVGARVQAVARRARIVVLDRPPVVGAALLGLDRLSIARVTRPEAEATLRAQLTDARLAGALVTE